LPAQQLQWLLITPATSRAAAAAATSTAIATPTGAAVDVCKYNEANIGLIKINSGRGELSCRLQLN